MIFWPAIELSAQDNDPCDEYVQIIFTRMSKESLNAEDKRAILNTAEAALDCYDGAKTPRTAWIFHKKIWGLTNTRRYEASKDAIKQFFQDYADVARERQLALVYMQAQHLHSLQAEVRAAHQALYKGYRYYEALGKADKVIYDLNGVYLSLRGEDTGEASIFISNAAQNLTPDSTSGENRFARARVLQMQSEIYLEQGENLHTAKAGFERAKEAFEALNEFEHVPTTLAMLGNTHAGLGDSTKALELLNQAIAYAEGHNTLRGNIYGLFQRGKFYGARRRYSDAETDLRASLALIDTTGMLEFKGDVLNALGNTLLAQGRLDEAEVNFRQTSIAAPDSMYQAHIRERAQAGLTNIQTTRMKKANGQRWLFLLIGILIGLLTGWLIYHIQTRKSNDLERGNLHLGNDPKANQTLDEVFIQRLHYLHQILFEPSELLPYIRSSSASLASKAEAGSLYFNKDLFLTLDAVEVYKDKRKAYTNDADNTIASYLRPRMWEHYNCWPTSPDEWRSFFDQHPTTFQ